MWNKPWSTWKMIYSRWKMSNSTGKTGIVKSHAIPADTKNRPIPYLSSTYPPSLHYSGRFSDFLWQTGENRGKPWKHFF
jgi:hypothetical protein